MSVHITDAAGTVRTVRHFGVLQVHASPGASVAGSTEGIGIVADPMGWSIGYTRQRWALLERDCRVVWWAPAGPVNKEFARDLLAAGRACVLDTH